MNEKEIEHQLQCFDLIEIDYRTHISAQKFFLGQLYQKVFDIPEPRFDKMYQDLYIQNWKEYYDSIPPEKRHNMLTEFYKDIFS